MQYSCEGNSNVFESLESGHFSRQLLTLDANQLQDITYADCNLVFNQISQADTHRISLSKANKLVEALNANATGSKIGCINHPQDIGNVSMDVLPEKLAGISGVTVALCIRLHDVTAGLIENEIEAHNWKYPVIVRQWDDIDGRHRVKLDKPSEISALPYTFFEKDCYLSPCYDYADNNGIYRKLRLVMVDGELTVRHVLYSDHWDVASNTTSFMKNNSWYYDHERKFITRFDAEIKPHINDMIQHIHEAVRLDYYGIDCALDDDMNLLIFEINPGMNILFKDAQLPEIRTSQISRIKQQIIKMIMNRTAQIPLDI